MDTFYEKMNEFLKYFKEVDQNFEINGMQLWRRRDFVTQQKPEQNENSQHNSAINQAATEQKMNTTRPEKTYTMTCKDEMFTFITTFSEKDLPKMKAAKEDVEFVGRDVNVRCVIELKK